MHFLHELRTPIALVDGPLQALSRHPGLDPAARELVAVSHQNILRLQRISQDFLDLSRVRAPVPATEGTTLDDWLRGLCAAARHHPALARAEVVEQLAAQGAEVDMPRTDLDRVFLNLLSNAVKFSHGRGEIRVGSAREGGQVSFFVADQGIGIDPRRHRAIFRRFRQADPTVAHRYGGFGIGLALVRELVARARGRVEVSSAPGAGARFTVHLPLRKAARASQRLPLRPPPLQGGAVDALELHLRRPSPPPPAQAPEAPAAAAVDGALAAHPIRVLVVEDEPEMRWLIDQSLGRDFHFEFAVDAESGWAHLQRHCPEVLLTDWRLPGETGLELAARTRALPAPPRVVLVSAHLDEDGRLAALGRGVDDFLPKPFSLAELGARLRNLARARRAEAALRAANAGLRQANDELSVARAALVQEEKLKSIGLLAAGLVHEIRNPVSYMQTAVGMLRARPAPEPAVRAEMLDACEDGLQRVAAIIDDLRIFSHRRSVDARALPWVSVDGAARRALRLCRAELAGLVVHERIAPARARADEGQLVQVFLNLLVNAARAVQAGVSREAAPDIELEVGIGAGRVHARVLDRGPGFPSDLLARAFEPFCTSRPSGEGMGLGLAISRAIVQSHGGRIRVANRPGGGAIAEFELPLSPPCAVPQFTDPPHAAPCPETP